MRLQKEKKKSDAQRKALRKAALRISSAVSGVSHGDSSALDHEEAELTQSREMAAEISSLTTNLETALSDLANASDEMDILLREKQEAIDARDALSLSLKVTTDELIDVRAELQKAIADKVYMETQLQVTKIEGEKKEMSLQKALDDERSKGEVLAVEKKDLSSTLESVRSEAVSEIERISKALEEAEVSKKTLFSEKEVLEGSLKESDLKLHLASSELEETKSRGQLLLTEIEMIKAQAESDMQESADQKKSIENAFEAFKQQKEKELHELQTRNETFELSLSILKRQFTALASGPLKEIITELEKYP